MNSKTHLQSNSPLSTARTPPPAPGASRPISAPGWSGEGICVRRRGCRRGTVWKGGRSVSDTFWYFFGVLGGGGGVGGFLVFFFLFSRFGDCWREGGRERERRMDGWIDVRTL